MSLGIDPVSGKLKQCVFDCVYCQVGRAKPCFLGRKIFVPTRQILDELKQLPNIHIDYITFSGTGEPTLARNLGVLIRGVKKVRKEPVAVITNSALLGRKDVQNELKAADLVMAKLDAGSQSCFKKINHPGKPLTLHKIITGLKRFRTIYRGTLALQIMFVDENLPCTKDIVLIAKQIKADKIFINTPLRPSACKPLSRKQILKIKQQFIKQKLDTISVFDRKRKKVKPINPVATKIRRGSNN